MTGQDPRESQPASVGRGGEIAYRAGLALPVLPALQSMAHQVAEEARVAEVIAREQESTSVEKAHGAGRVPGLRQHHEVGLSGFLF